MVDGQRFLSTVIVHLFPKSRWECNENLTIIPWHRNIKIPIKKSMLIFSDKLLTIRNHKIIGIRIQFPNRDIHFPLAGAPRTLQYFRH